MVLFGEATRDLLGTGTDLGVEGEVELECLVQSWKTVDNKQTSTFHNNPHCTYSIIGDFKYLAFEPA